LSSTEGYGKKRKNCRLQRSRASQNVKGRGKVQTQRQKRPRQRGKREGGWPKATYFGSTVPDEKKGRVTPKSIKEAQAEKEREEKKKKVARALLQNKLAQEKKD